MSSGTSCPAKETRLTGLATLLRLHSQCDRRIPSSYFDSDVRNYPGTKLFPRIFYDNISCKGVSLILIMILIMFILVRHTYRH
jgi:hypothetical protein